MQSLALFRGARALSLARCHLIPQRSRLLCGCAVPLVRAPHRNWYGSRREEARKMESPSSAAAAASRFALSSSTSSSLPLPLCELPASTQATAADLLAWRNWSKEIVESLGAEGLSADGGPDKRELLKELDWFLEDAVASPPWSSSSSSKLLLQQRREEEEENNSSPPPLISLRSSFADLSARWEARIKERMPFQYAVGIAHWRRVTLAVGSGVLCPRPETEQLVDLAAAAFREMTKAKAKSSSPLLSSLPWADLGTGSGAIAVGLALDALVVVGSGGENGGASTSTPSTSCSIPLPRVFAVDASPLAASWARLNVERLNLEDRVTVLEGSWLEPLFELEKTKEASSSSSSPSSKQGEEAFLAGVVSNPPYIPQSQLSTLQREVRDHEPNLALDGGPGAGLDSLRPLCSSAARALACGGFLALETAGKEQASEVASDLLEKSGAFEEVQLHEDLFGVARFVTATRRKRG